MGLRTDEACMHLKLHVNPFSPAVAVAAAAGHGPIKGSTGKDTMLCHCDPGELKELLQAWRHVLGGTFGGQGVACNIDNLGGMFEGQGVACNIDVLRGMFEGQEVACNIVQCHCTCLLRGRVSNTRWQAAAPA
eukprot:1142708-Pelagomonas_calceolata.AAC.4